MNNESIKIEIDTRVLDKLLKIFKSVPTVRVGVLDSKDNRQHGKNTNAEIGAKHEFGTDGMPVRSFLRVPIAENLQKELDAAGAFSDDSFKLVMQEGTADKLMKRIGHVAEGIVQEAFNTGGYGKWKPSNMEHKKVHQTLVETQQLRNSISSEVVDK